MRQRHFRNYRAAGQAVFVTNTCLDFVPLFASERRKVMMARSLTDDLLHYGSALHAFVGRSVNAGARQTRFTCICRFLPASLKSGNEIARDCEPMAKAPIRSNVRLKSEFIAILAKLRNLSVAQVFQKLSVVFENQAV
ncbi:MAG: hypothetical protein KF812_13290 [Fimbriimonadaceae bacterium]|nr:hypothetical protein [Fimbriimonadaceae bacterium]